MFSYTAKYANGWNLEHIAKLFEEVSCQGFFKLVVVLTSILSRELLHCVTYTPQHVLTVLGEIRPKQ